VVVLQKIRHSGSIIQPPHASITPHGFPVPDIDSLDDEITHRSRFREDRSPDAAWVALERINALNPNPDGFLPLAPDFVIELRSSSDSLKTLQDKMIEYRDNGVRLGWFLNAKERAVEIYRPGKEVELLNSPTSLFGEEVLPGFVLDLKDIWG
jgi:Uma2 family endonuclease